MGAEEEFSQESSAGAGGGGGGTDYAGSDGDADGDEGGDDDAGGGEGGNEDDEADDDPEDEDCDCGGGDSDGTDGGAGDQAVEGSSEPNQDIGGEVGADGGDAGDTGAAALGGGIGGGGSGGGPRSRDAVSEGVESRAVMVHSGIDLKSADKRHGQVDYAGAGSAPLRVARIYHSNLAVNSAQVTSPHGAGWRGYYDRSVQVLSGSQLRLHRANGRVLDYVFNGSAWVSALPGGVLTSISGGWQYVNHRNEVEQYNASGRLVNLSRAGLATTLQYDGANRLALVVNPFGRTLAYAYDGAGRIASVALPDGNAITYAYDGYNNLVSTRFGDGSMRQYVYENTNFRNALTGIVDETGRRRLTWGYDGAGRPNYGHYGNGTGRLNIDYAVNQASVTDVRGTQRTRTFAAVGARTVLASVQTAATADSQATVATLGHDGAGNVASITTKTGEVRLVSADNRGRVLSATRAAGTAQALPAQISWHPTFRRPTQVTMRGITRDNAIDGYGRITQVTKTGTNGVAVTTQRKVYNAQNLLQSVTDARGATTSFTYDALGNRTSHTNAAGQTTYFSSFNAHGRAGRIDRANGSVAIRTFDVRGRLTAQTVGTRTTGFAYDAAGRLARLTRPDGSWRQRSYDAAGLLASVANHRGETTVITRDAAGQPTSRVTYAANGSVAKSVYTQYNALGKVAGVLDSRGYRTQLNYAGDGRLNGVTTPLGLAYGRQLDLLDRTVALTQPNTTAMRQTGGPATVSSGSGYHATYGTRQSASDTVAVATGFAADALNRNVAEAGIDAGAKGWVRNIAGDTTSVTDPRGVTLSIARDAFGRMTSITPSTGTSVGMGYVAGRSDALAATMTDPSGSTAWAYDGQGRLLTKTQTVDGVARKLTIARDTLGRVSSMTYPSGMRVDVGYAGDVVASLAVNGANLLSNVGYRAFSKTATGWIWGNGSNYARGFDADGRVTSVTLGYATRNYGYDASGRVVSYSDTGAAGTTGSSFGYDEAGQLIAYSGPAGSFSYTYDTNGNRKSVVKNGVSSTNTYQAGSNRIMTSPRGAYSYNADGNPGTDGYLGFTYDNYGRLTQMSGNSDTNTRVYNGQGLRVKATTKVYVEDGCAGMVSASKTRLLEPPRRLTTTKTTHDPEIDAKSTVKSASKSVGAGAGGGATPNMRPCGAGGWQTTGAAHFFHADDGRFLGEYDTTTGYRQETIWFNGMPVATVINGVLYYVRSDHLGTPRSIARASDNLEVWRWESDPFGNSYPTAPAGTGITYNLRFAGQVYEAYSGYYYNVMRDYDPYTGRYLQADPIGLGGGMSRYAYVEGNPLSYTDPEGLMGNASGASQGISVPKVPSGNGPAAACYMSCKVAATPFTSAFSATTSMVGGGMCAAGGSVAGPAGAAGGYAFGRVAGTVGGFAAGQVVSGMVCSAVCGF